MKLIALVLASTTFFASQTARSADEACFEFTRLEAPVKDAATRPAIVLAHSKEHGLFTQEVVPLNEEADDALQKMEVGRTICLKGTRSYTPYMKYLVYSVRRQ